MKSASSDVSTSLMRSTGRGSGRESIRTVTSALAAREALGRIADGETRLRGGTGEKPKVWAAAGTAAASVKPARILMRRTDRLRPAAYAPAIGQILAIHGYRTAKGRAGSSRARCFQRAPPRRAERRPAGCARTRATGAANTTCRGSRGWRGCPPNPVGRAEEKRDRHIERLGDPHQPSCADPVHALFVFLDLLERDAEQIAEFGLRHALGHAPRADALADLDIVRIGALGPGFDTHRAQHPSATPNLCASGSFRWSPAALTTVIPEFAHRWVARGGLGYWGGRRGTGDSALGGARRRLFSQRQLDDHGKDVRPAGQSRPSNSRG